MIARTWRGWVRTEQAAAYVEYITRTGLSEYKRTPGNLRAQMWTADLGDGRTQVMTVSWWSSRTDMEGFAGQNIDVCRRHLKNSRVVDNVAVLYPEDDDYLIDRETTVMHYEVAGHCDTCPDVPRSRPGPTATQESLAWLPVAALALQLRCESVHIEPNEV